MSDFKLRYEEEGTGCAYCWDEEKKQWVKICPISPADLPPSIRKQVREAQNNADLVLRLPL